MSENRKDQKEPERHILKSVAQGKEIEKTKLQKAVGVFFSEDLDSIKGSIVEDYIRPRAKSFVADMVRKTKEMIVDNINSAAQIIFFGDSKKGSKTGEYNGQKVNYVSYYTGSSYDGNTYYYSNDGTPVKKAEPVTAIKQIGIEDYKEALDAVTELYSIHKRYGKVTVADYYLTLKINPSKLDNDFGWYELGRLEPRYVASANLYVIDMPKPTVIER